MKIHSCTQNKNSILIKAAFLLSLLYWIYLAFTSQMQLIFDAEGYSNLGAVLYQEGWTEYLKGGPRREPLYPFLISQSMHIGNIFSLPYLKVQTFFQILILFTTQLLTLNILRRLAIKDVLSSLVILYIGISPAIVNTAFSLYSEIAVYPFILGIILFSAKSWSLLRLQADTSPGRQRYIHVMGLGLLLGILFVLTTFVKGIFELIAPLFLLPFLFFLIRALIKKEKDAFVLALLFVFTFLTSFYSAIFAYKLANQKFNGHFAITDRAGWALYGNTARRMEKLTPQRLLTAMAFAPGEGVCHSLFGEEPCRFWSFRESDGFGYSKLNKLQQSGLPKDQIDKKLLTLSLRLVLQNPLQYMLFMGIEGCKMMFWESTQIGCVSYPEWLAQLFSYAPLKNGLRLIMSLLTMLALLYQSIIIWSRLRVFLSPESHDESLVILSPIFTLVFLFISVHSFFFVLTRYILPIAPLYLILISYSAHCLFFKVEK